ncbi:MAG TPA: squalene/phytoene synthase family protein [Gemmatimonadota bacterium]|nr:squalene/phytoene synthase family protein [Gemmatimonadota bacterium]
MIEPDDVDTGVEAGYDACQAETRLAARNFWLGIRLLPPDRRRALAAVYCFCRRSDDAVDGDGSGVDRARRLAAVRADLERTLAGEPPDPRWTALADATARFTIPAGLYRDLLDGVARDLDPGPFPSWEALRAYCHGVAGVVGLMGLRIFGGLGREAERAAEEIGYALQLTNILRDLREDAQRARWYLPIEESARFGVTREAVAAGQAEPGFDALVAVFAERARGFYAAGPRLYARLPRSTRPCPAALVGVYRGVLERIAARPQAVLAGRVGLAPARKLARGLAAAAASMWA